MKGSMTVEAAYLFPFCFLIVTIVCSLGIYRYNLAVLEMTGYECILCSVRTDEESEEALKENLLRRAKTFGEGRTLAMGELEVSVKITETKVSVSYRGTQSLLHLPFKVSATYERTHPETVLRLARRIRGE